MTLLGVGALVPTQVCHGSTAIGEPGAVDASYIASQVIPVDGKLVAAWRIGDRDGEHVLVLARKAGSSPANPGAGRVERIDLAARFYKRVEGGKWVQEWVIRDSSDCPGLDVDGDFFKAAVSFTDLDKDGRIEVTVPYHLFCGGGVDPRTVKVILREGDTKLAIRGESLVRYPGQAPFGGAHRHDKALLAPERAAYKTHMDAIWRRVADDSRR